MRKWFRKYEYEIGMGYYDTSGLFESVHFDKKEYYSQLCFGWAFTIMSFTTSIIIILIFIAGAPWWLIAELVIAVVLLCVLTPQEQFQKARDLHKRLKQVSKSIKDNAKMAYGIDWREPAIECYEVHVAEDCFLCGAS